MATLPRPLPAGNAGPQTVRALIGVCDGDPAAEATGIPADRLDTRYVASFSLAAREVAEEAHLTAIRPPARPPFPEPPAGLPYFEKDIEVIGVYRTAWPHLSADQRAEVARLLDITARSARRFRDDVDAAADSHPQPPAPLARDWHQLRVNAGEAAELVGDHLAGWVAEVQADPAGDDCPRGVPDALAAAGWVLANMLGSLNAEVEGRWASHPAHHVFPQAPLADADPDAVPAGWDGRRDKLAGVVALLDGVADDLGRCLDQQERLPGFDPVNGSLLDALGGGRLALEAAVAGLRTDLDPEVIAATARRDLARLSTAKRVRAAEATPDREAA